ncbi:conjugal transfer protein TraF [Lactobacillus sp. ESL0225]|uniref:conjugal transfer protein TraF n=1 Tax=Lactobacillus sp. ESL0225 TaxID=2069351 RepID=UPI000EFC851A|nr:conjugal transfer protein TraF [Lactobacillus sp. ESL0225]RMC51182.1 hypothetical protein F5ESL0225_02190 [Lactobacillus sp. ESL0225]
MIIKIKLILNQLLVSKKYLPKKYAYLFWGKKSCPFCRAFVPKLTEISQKRHIEIYYIDTTNTDTDPILKKMRKHFKVTGVPCLTKIKTYKSFKTLNRAKTSLSKFLTKQF